MGHFTSQYVAKKPDRDGCVLYSEAEHRVWRTLFERQVKVIENHACTAFIEGLSRLKLTVNEIPQIPEVSRILYDLSGFKVEPVAALIPAREFFELLSVRKFPCATFIRREEELDYLQEPDIFHEIFGHCPLLTDPTYADFVAKFAALVLTHSEEDWPLLQRVFWFTVEFGLIETHDGIRAYGGGILSSKAETIYSVKSDVPMRVYFDPIAVLRTPYRIDIKQPIYFVIKDFETLYALCSETLPSLLERARALGEYPPFFPFTPGDPALHIHAC